MNCRIASFLAAAVFILPLAGRAVAADEPVVACEWTPQTAPRGEHAPKIVPFRKGCALRLVTKNKTVVNLSETADTERLRQTGPLTLAVVVQLTAEPQQKCPIVSKWHCTEGGRSYELGVMPDRRPFLAISASGTYDRRAREVFSAYPLEIGKPYLVVGTFEPGRRMVLYVNGARSAATSTRVPKAIFDSPTPVLIGSRPPRGLHVDALLGGLWFYDSALSHERVTALVKKLELTESPGPEVVLFEDAIFAEGQKLPPARAITRGPKFHWFSYYDKFQFDPTDRYVLSMEVDFEHRSPTPDDVIKIGMVDLEEDNRWIELGETQAWCWQQGCMLQWRPGSESEILWNDREGDRFVCHVLDFKTGKRRTLPQPIHHVSPDGKWALVTDVARVGEMRRSYGYVGIPDPNRDVGAPEDSGLWRMDLDTGESKLLFSIADVAKIPYPGADPKQHKHYFNHIQWSPDGRRFLFLNRGRGVGTRMFTAAADGGDLRLVHTGSSHYTWRDPEHILVWAGSYELVKDDGSLKKKTVWHAPNGHESYVPHTNNEWIVTDTYPMGEERLQHLYLFHVPTRQIVPLGHFCSPPEYGGEWRCDTHPRLNRAGTHVCIDSPHGTGGRQLYLIEIGPIVGTGKK